MSAPAGDSGILLHCTGKAEQTMTFEAGSGFVEVDRIHETGGNPLLLDEKELITEFDALQARLQVQLQVAIECSNSSRKHIEAARELFEVLCKQHMHSLNHTGTMLQDSLSNEIVGNREHTISLEIAVERCSARKNLSKFFESAEGEDQPTSLQAAIEVPECLLPSEYRPTAHRSATPLVDESKGSTERRAGQGRSSTGNVLLCAGVAGLVLLVAAVLLEIGDVPSVCMRSFFEHSPRFGTAHTVSAVPLRLPWRLAARWKSKQLPSALTPTTSSKAAEASRSQGRELEVCRFARQEGGGIPGLGGGRIGLVALRLASFLPPEFV